MTRAKRTFDTLAAGAGLVLLTPLLGLLAFLVKRDDGGPVFFRQERVGYRGRPFRIWKFRTMVRDAAAPHRRERFARDSHRRLAPSLEAR